MYLVSRQLKIFSLFKETKKQNTSLFNLYIIKFKSRRKSFVQQPEILSVRF